MKQYTDCRMTVWEIDALWDLFSRTPNFAAAIPRERFNQMLEKGLIQLWVEPDALTPVVAMVTELQETQEGRIANILSFAGTNVDDERRLFSSIKVWARKNDCKSLRAVCKDAQARLFARDGFVKIANVIELELKDE